MPRLHRNNAAEWAMVIALTPVAWVVRLWKRVVRTRASGGTSGSAAGTLGREKKTKPAEKPRKPVTIEGLPPRTMN